MNKEKDKKRKEDSSTRKDNILDLAKYRDKLIHVKYIGGREGMIYSHKVTGILKGFDQLTNLVLDETKEYIRDISKDDIVTDEFRELGLVVCRGTCINFISPADGIEEIENPFDLEDGN